MGIALGPIVGGLLLARFWWGSVLFALTQFLQFGLGYSALQAGVRVLPAACAIAVVAPLSTLLVRVIGTKVTVTAGLLVIGGGNDIRRDGAQTCLSCTRGRAISP